ncbi:phosphoribosylformylglycinamidine synthase subunit PurS [Ornithinibacillus sp. 4-3]|uniref:Phosphoribosylformylglycinamidine synthase subunit PurS n=1 Tax=Ornithinibacillus sp. 4-3 TaxID=3231488 RepID=A0AB39HT95_9BACI
MRKVQVYITLKHGVLDPQGKAIKTSLDSLGYPDIEDVRVGKYVELQVKEGPELESKVIQMCEQLLANPVIEDYRIELEEA